MVKSRVEREEKKARNRADLRNSGVRAIAQNRRALHEYTIEDKLEAGIVLTGPEVKSLRDGKGTLTDGYIFIASGEAWLEGVHIAPYEAGSWNNGDPKRKRKLLLHKREIEKLATRIQRSGSTCVPLSLYFKGRHVKAQIALVTGKKQHDKRETIKRREAERETRAAIKAARR